MNKSYVAEKLEDRSIIRVTGPETSSFLQGMVTNDIDHLMDEDDHQGLPLFSSTIEPKDKENYDNNERSHVTLLKRSMYAMLLNTSGRVIFDIIVIQLSNTCFLLDCHAESASKLVKHLKMYRVRRKIDISIDNAAQVWSIFSANMIPIQDLNNSIMAEDYEQLALSVSDTISTVDPRVKQLGFRVIIKDSDSKTGHILGSISNDNQPSYTGLKYRLGVGESPYEIIPGKALPLESNADYLHGVSFHKGCYIGQELTARTHHTGVVRKRVMPIFINTKCNDNVTAGANIENLTSGKSVGKILSRVNDNAIGLMRVDECMNAEKNNELLVLSEDKAVNVTVSRPEWWPEVSPSKLPGK